MTKKEIEKGAGLLLAAVSGCEQMVELLRDVYKRQLYGFSAGRAY